MASSSASNERVNGMVILVNLYLSKTDPAPVFGDLRPGEPIQAFIVHHDKQGLGTNVNKGDMKSNTMA